MCVCVWGGGGGGGGVGVGWGGVVRRDGAGVGEWSLEGFRGLSTIQLFFDSKFRSWEILDKFTTYFGYHNKNTVHGLFNLGTS